MNREMTTAPPASNHGTYAGANLLISGGHHSTVFGNYLVNNAPEDQNRDWIVELKKNTVIGAFHNSGERRDAPKCHPHTRIAVIKEIMDWVRNANGFEQFLWLYGPVGSGKSSLAQTIAELCEQEGRLASNFFFSRTAPGRNTEIGLIPSLACQLTVAIPEICVYMASAINSDSLIFSRSLPTQFDTLILRPLEQLASTNQNLGARLRKNLIVIDGLDECGNPECQRYILTALFTATQKSFVPLIFFISSRPEQVIRDVFNGELSTCTRRIILDDRYDPDEDIKTFLHSKFNDIKKHHPLASLLPTAWPSVLDIDYLVQKASGQFIYASTVTKFIESPRGKPTERLKIILQLSFPGQSTPFADLDTLYKHILLSIEPLELEKVTCFFAFLFAMSQLEFPPHISSMYQTPGLIERFLHFESGDLYLVLGDLHSIVDVPPLPSRSIEAPQQIRLFHASLGDFLQDKGRSGSLLVDMEMYCAKFARICIGNILQCLYSKDPPDFDQRQEDGVVNIVSYCAFLQLFATAHSDKFLLHDLLSFPAEAFIESVFNIPFPIYQFMPTFLDWLKKKDTPLYKIYNTVYTNHIKSRLITCDPQWKSLLTYTTLNVRNNQHDYFVYAVNIFIRNSNQSRVLEHFFGNSIYCGDAPDISDYLTRLSDILTCPKQAAHYHVNTSRYIEFAMELFDKLTKKGLINSIVLREAEILLESFFAILMRIPDQPKLAQYLQENRNTDNRTLQKRERRELAHRIDAYIKSSIISTEDARRPITIPTIDRLLGRARYSKRIAWWHIRSPF